MIQQIIKILPNKGDYSVIENFNIFKISYELDYKEELDFSTLYDLLLTIKEKWLINIKIDYADTPIQLQSIESYDTFKTKCKKEIDEVDDEKVTFEFNIKKGNDLNEICIYNIESFYETIEKSTVLDFLLSLKSFYSKPNKLRIYLFDEGESNVWFQNNFIAFNIKREKVTIPISREISDYSHFSSKTEFPFSPIDFYTDVVDNISNPFIDKLTILSKIFSVIALFDYSTIKNDNLEYKIIGYKTYEGSIGLDSINVDSSEVYQSIYTWVYTEESNVFEKINLVRNTLSIYLEKADLSIPINAFYSIQSGFKLYLQNNLDKYLNIREKILEQLDSINKKADSTASEIIINYQKSNYAFISFFVSIFVLRALSKQGFVNIFTKEATIITLVLILFSIIYFFYSLWIYSNEKKQLEKKYSNLKKRYKDLLIQDDIDKILNNGEEFIETIGYLNKRKNAFSIIWIITILIFLAMLLSLSSYLNWSSFF